MGLLEMTSVMFRAKHLNGSSEYKAVILKTPMNDRLLR
jgi:hypothetical protein